MGGIKIGISELVNLAEGGDDSSIRAFGPEEK